MGATSNICDYATEAPRITSSSSSISDVPYSRLTVQTSLSLPEMTPRIIELCKELFKNWSKQDDSCFHVETVSGGITNLLLKVSVKAESGDTESVTVRLYGPNTDYVINRERELHAIKYLSAAGFGAKLLAVFANGTVQSFINARTLVPADMRIPNLAAQIAKELHRFHQVEIPGSKEPQLWNDIFKFYEKASVLEFVDGEKQKKYRTISFTEIHDELVELKELTGRLNSPVVYAHNDLLCGNIMANDEQGNVLCRYPGKDEQYHFFKHYLQPDKPHMVSVKDLEALYVETNAYMLASHIFWALWALIQAKMSPIDFDYLEYFFLRYNEFKKQKGGCLSLAQSFLQGS